MIGGLAKQREKDGNEHQMGLLEKDRKGLCIFMQKERLV